MDSLSRSELKSGFQSRRYSLGTEEGTEREMEVHVNFRLRRKSTIPIGLSVTAMSNWKRVKCVVLATIRFVTVLKDIRRFGVSLRPDRISSESSGPLPSKSSFILRPEGFFVKFWAILTSLLLVFTAFYTPYKVCMSAAYDEASLELDYVIDAWFGCDIVLTFLTGFESKGGIVEMAPKKIAARYFKGWFVFDLIACFPFQSFNLDEAKSYNGLLRLLRLPRLYRLVRVLRIVKVMQSIGHYDFFDSIMRGVKVHSGVLRLLKFSFMVIIIVHVAGCFWFFLASFYDLSPDTWVTKAGRQNESTSDLYLISIYWVFTVITTVGFGDIVAANSLERVYSMLVMGFGIAFYAYTISNVSSILTSMDQRNLEYKTRTAAMNDFANETSLPKDLRESVMSQIKYNYEANLDSWYTKDKLMSELPAHLRTQISINVHKTLVAKLSFFQNKDPGFISFVIPKLKPVAYSIGELIYQVGDYASETFFLLKGEIMLKDEDGVGFKTYMKGCYFGEIEVMRECLRNCTCQVISKKANCLVLSKDHLREVMDEFPSVAVEMIEYAKNRSHRNLDAIRFARMNLNCSTRKRISKRSSRLEASHMDSFWNILKQQYSKFHLIGRRSRSGSITPTTPMKTLRSSFSELANVHEDLPLLMKSRSSSYVESSHLILSPPISATHSLSRRVTSLSQSKSQVLPESSKKVTLPLPQIPSIIEEELMGSQTSNRDTSSIISPEVESVIREFERRDSALQMSISHTISRLIDVCKHQTDLDERLKSISERLDPSH